MWHSRPKVAELYVAPITDRMEVLGVYSGAESTAPGGRRCRMSAVNSKATTKNLRMSKTVYCTTAIV